jgi:hypothetical protein
MRKPLPIVLALVLAAAASPAAAQHARPFLTDTLGSAAEYARLIRACRDVPRPRHLVATCDVLVSSFNGMFSHRRVANERELAAYVEDLVVKPCPHGTIRIARIVDGVADLNYSRDTRPAELCLYDTGEGLFISSLSCGQWIGGSYPLTTALVATTEPTPEPAPPVATAITAIAQATSFPAPPPPVPRHAPWYSLRRTSGRVFWGAIVAGAAGGTVYAVACRERVIIILR